MDGKHELRALVIRENATPREIGSVLYESMGNWGWFTSYNYKRKEPKKYEAADFPDDLRKEINFTTYMYYVANLYLSEGGDFELSRKDFARYSWDKVCVYCSVLFYLLIKEENKESHVLNGRKMKYVQGFYQHKLRKDIPELFTPIYGGDDQMGIHAFVTIDDVVFDFTINQQAAVFNLEKSYVAGNIPNGFDYYGYPESLTVVDQYWKMFAKEAGMSPRLWLLKHRQNALNMVLRDLESMND